jgi:CBS domain-containing protein
MKVRDLMTRDPVCCTGDTPIAVVARLMSQHDCGAIPVVGDLTTRLPIGIVTDRDIVRRTLAAGIDPLCTVARDCMTAPPITIAEDARLHECVKLLELSMIRRVIVVDAESRCVGIVAQADVARRASKRETGDLVREVSQPSVPAFAL